MLQIYNKTLYGDAIKWKLVTNNSQKDKES